MKHVSILIPNGQVSLVNIEGTHQILSEVNKMLVAQDKEPVFRVQLVGLDRETKLHNGMFVINPGALISEVDKTDLIFIPAIHGDPLQVRDANRPFLQWITDQYHSGAEIASLCLGSFFLAQTGLLDGKVCSTHWIAAAQFRSMFPDVRLADEKIITDDKGIYTSGGAYAYLNLLVYIIEKYVDRATAIRIAKSFMIDIDRNSQSPFMMFTAQKDHSDEIILEAQAFIEKNFSEKLTVDQLARQIALGRRSLERRFRKATGNSVTEYIQRVKIEAAKKGFETSRKNINEIMYDVGYVDVKAFRAIFRKITGLAPVQYRNKYNKDLAVA